MSRWGVFLAALAGMVSLVVGSGIGLSHAFAVPAPAPALRTVPAGALTAAGITLERRMVCGWAHPVKASTTLVVVLDALNASMITTIPVQTGA